jgi:hypothetical protein
MPGIQERLPLHELDVFEARLDAATAADDAVTRLLKHDSESGVVMMIHKRTRRAVGALTLEGISAGYLSKNIEEE